MRPAAGSDPQGEPDTTSAMLRSLPQADEFVRLRDGNCHYRIDGPQAGPIILLLHGATVAAWEFERLVPMLSAAGYRTIRADLFGHGYSDRPRARYAHALFVRQLLDLLDVLTPTAPVHLLGHSLGAALAARLVCAQPQRFGRVVLAAPLLNFTINSPAARLLRVPILGECLIPSYVVPMLIRRRTRNYRCIEDGRFVGRFKDQLRRPGFGRALLSMFRNDALGDQSDCYATLAQQPHRTLILRGSEDTLFTPAQVVQLRALLTRAALHEFKGVAHALLLTAPELVAPAVLEFFQ